MPEARRPGRRWRWGDDPSVLTLALEGGGVVAIPSESSYGLAVDPRSAAGVESIYRLKGRDRGKPLPVVAADLEQLAVLGLDIDWPPLRRVAEHWPAALSLVVPLPSGTADAVPAAAGGATLAVRVPAHAEVRSLLRSVRSPWTATSANVSGEAPILDPADLDRLEAGNSCVAADAADAGVEAPELIVVDDGLLPGGPPSTLVAWDDDAATFRILRPGRFDASRLH